MGSSALYRAHIAFLQWPFLTWNALFVRIRTSFVSDRSSRQFDLVFLTDRSRLFTMPKRKIAVQNKETEQQQQASTSTRSSTKRTRNEEPTSSKKPKLEDVHADKENVPKRPTAQQNNKSKAAPKKEPTPPPPPVIEQPESTDESDDDFFDRYDDEVDDDDEDDDDMQMQATTNSAQCVDHPTNKQYVIYPNGGRNGEPFVISKTARFWNQKYFKVMGHVNPDAYGMYIHNDFGSYGELEVVENCLLDLTKAIFMVQRRGVAQANMVRKPADSVNYVLAFRRIEALTLVLDNADGMTNIDDGERYLQMIRVVGACYVTVLRGLFPQAMFTPIDKIDRNLVKKLTSISRQLPNLKAVLEEALTVGHLLITIGDVCSAYTKMLQVRGSP